MTASSAATVSTEPPGDSTAARRIGPRTVVSALWVFVALNYIYCDVLSLMYPPDLRETLDGEVGGIEINQGFLLAAAVLMTIPFSAVLTARIAPHRVARWWSIVGGAVMALVQVGTLGMGSDVTLHYAYFSVVEAATTVAIVWVAVRRWKIDA